MSTREQLLERISVNPAVCFGKPCIKGSRIWVSLIVDLLASGVSEEEILNEYPGLEREDVRAALLYASETARGRYFGVPVESAS